MFSPDRAGELTVMPSRNPHPHMESYLSRAADSLRGFADASGALPHDVHFVSSIGDPDALEKARDSIKAALGNAVNMNLIRNITGSGCALDVLPKGVSKWSALESLIGSLGIGKSEVGAIGDDENDIEMLKNAGMSYAMGNARPEVKSAAKRVTGSHENDGVALALREVLSSVS
jgi:HAD superfamily hydrolase (TIGR01484 family)